MRHGEAHAERVCLGDLEGPAPADATLYVSLEPCDHHGRQPPCVDMLLERRVRRVVYASADPNPLTAGRGPARLAAAGVAVLQGPVDVERRALQQNAGFHSVHLRGRPYVTAKWAMTRNGRFSTGDPTRRWVSGAESRAFVHYLRAGSGAVATGIGTVLADDPQLTVRGALAARCAVPPVRAVYDRSLRLPTGSAIARTARQAPVVACCDSGADQHAEAELRRLGVDVWRFSRTEPESFLRSSLEMLAERGINDVLLEAGPRLLETFHAAGLVDALVAFVAPFDAPEAEPGLPDQHALVQAALEVPGQPSGEDARHVAVLHPAWELAAPR